jgi:hypothetical protein
MITPRFIVTETVQFSTSRVYSDSHKLFGKEFSGTLINSSNGGFQYEHQIVGFFSTYPNPSSRTMAVGITRPLTEMSTRNLAGGKARSARKADSLTTICEPIVSQMWDPRHLTSLWASTACYSDSFTLLLYFTSV